MIKRSYFMSIIKYSPDHKNMSFASCIQVHVSLFRNDIAVHDIMFEFLSNELSDRPGTDEDIRVSSFNRI